jgi:predicted alpha/beta-fold hydrolase
VFQPGTLVIDHLGQPTQVPYIAAFHRDRRLPLVVGVSGINGTVDGKFTVDILESLYRTGEFHVVHLESLTSVDHQVRNQRPFAGGFPEGVLLYETLAALRERIGHADDIDQVHLLGVSYGGLLCGVAAHCEDRFQAGILDGAVLAFSAPVDLKTLFQNLRVLRLIHDRVRDGYLAAGRDRYFRKAELGLSDRELDALDFDSYVRKIAFPYLQRVHRSLQVDFPDLPEVRDPEDVYALSSVRPFLGQLGVPLLFVHAYDDPVLSAEDHFHQVLARCPNPLVDGILLRDGGHLGFDAVCGYPFTAAVAERYFRYWSGRI